VLLCIVIYLQLGAFLPSTTALPDTWRDFTAHCAVRAVCVEKYMHREVAWQGHAIRVNFIDDFFTRYKATVLVAMEVPEQTEQNVHTDVVLHFDYFNYEKYRTEILNTTRGDNVQFNATVVSVKEENDVQRRKVVMLEVNAFRKGSEKVFIAPHVHANGRYHVDQNMIKNAYSEVPGVEEHKALKDSRL
jgi:hypothetical protein